jgi:hypothetical protein
VAQVKARARPPPADEIESVENARRLIGTVRRQTDLENSNDATRVVEKRGAAAAVSTDHMNDNHRRSVDTPPTDKLSLVETQPVA